MKRSKKSRRPRRSKAHPQGRQAVQEEVVQGGSLLPEGLDLSGPEFLAQLGQRAPGEIRELARQLEDSLASCDAIDVIAHLFLGNSVIDPETYRETTFPGLSAAVEFGATLLLRRSSPDALGTRQVVEPGVIDGFNAGVRELLRWGSILQIANTGGQPDHASLRYTMLGRTMLLRHPRLEYQERAVLDDVFGARGPIDLVHDAGFSLEHAYAIIDAFRTLPMEKLNRRELEILQRAVTSRPATRELSESQLRKRAARLPLDDRRTTAMELASGLGEVLSLTKEELLSRSRVPERALESFMTLFSVTFGYKTPPGADWLEGFIAGFNPTLTRPVIDDSRGSYLCVGPGLLFFALRDTLTKAIKGKEAQEALQRRRAKFLEAAAIKALSEALRPDLVHERLVYVVDDEVAETDGLLTLGTVAFIVEGKAAPLSDAARRAAPKALPQELKDLVTDGAGQADRVRALIERDGGLTSVQPNGERQFMDLRHITRIIPLVVTLEDLGMVSTNIEEMIRAGLVANASAPLILALHDLEIVCDIVELPAQLVHFFERRRDVNRRQTIVALDELDYFMYYLKRGLYFEGLLGGEGQPNHVFIGSLTDDLDAYLMHKTGVRRRQASKPRQQLPRRLQQVLQDLDRMRPAGWVEGSLALLDMDGEGRKFFDHLTAEVRRQARKDKQAHDASWIGADLGITLMCLPAGRRQELSSRLSDYAQAKRHHQRRERWFGFGRVVDDEAIVTAFVAVLPPHPASADLDALCRKIGLDLSAEPVG